MFMLTPHPPDHEYYERFQTNVKLTYEATYSLRFYKRRLTLQGTVDKCEIHWLNGY